MLDSRLHAFAGVKMMIHPPACFTVVSSVRPLPAGPSQVSHMGLETVKILMDMEDHFPVSIPDDLASDIVTVGDLHRVIVELLLAQGRQRNQELGREVWDRMMAVLKKNGIPLEGVRPDSRWLGDITRHG